MHSLPHYDLPALVRHPLADTRGTPVGDTTHRVASATARTPLAGGAR
jgi:hypothetical protein